MTDNDFVFVIQCRAKANDESHVVGSFVVALVFTSVQISFTDRVTTTTSVKAVKSCESYKSY